MSSFNSRFQGTRAKIKINLNLNLQLKTIMLNILRNKFTNKTKNVNLGQNKIKGKSYKKLTPKQMIIDKKKLNQLDYKNFRIN